MYGRSKWNVFLILLNTDYCNVAQKLGLNAGNEASLVCGRTAKIHGSRYKFTVLEDGMPVEKW